MRWAAACCFALLLLFRSDVADAENFDNLPKGEAKKAREGGWTSKKKPFEQPLKNSPFHLAAKEGDLTLLEKHYKKVLLNAKRSTGNELAPMHYAAAAGHKNVVQWLFEKGALIDIVDKAGLTPLQYAVNNELVSMTEFLLGLGANASTANGVNSLTPLMTAAMKPNENLLEVLLEAGADPNMKIDGGAGALHYAVGANYVAIVEMLLDGGADVDLDGVNQGETPLAVAVQLNNTNLFHLLVNKGANVRGMPGGVGLYMATARGNVYMIELLLKAGANVFHARGNRDGESLLHLTARTRNVLLMKRFIEAGLGGDELNIESQGPILTHVKNGSVAVGEILDTLLGAGADINQPDVHGATPLHEVARTGVPSTAEALLERGAELSGRDINGGSVLFHAAAAHNNGMIRFLLEKGVDPNLPVANGMTPLIINALNNGGDLEAFELLLQGGADPMQTETAQGRSVLHYAASKNGWQICELLLKHGANIDAVDNNGQTVLHASAHEGASRAVEWLLSHGADVTARSFEGETPTDVARYARRRTLAKYRPSIGYFQMALWLRKVKLPVGEYFRVLRALKAANLTDIGELSRAESVEELFADSACRSDADPPSEDEGADEALLTVSEGQRKKLYNALRRTSGKTIDDARKMAAEDTKPDKPPDKIIQKIDARKLPKQEVESLRSEFEPVLPKVNHTEGGEVPASGGDEREPRPMPRPRKAKSANQGAEPEKPPNEGLKVRPEQEKLQKYRPPWMGGEWERSKSGTDGLHP